MNTWKFTKDRTTFWMACTIEEVNRWLAKGWKAVICRQQTQKIVGKGFKMKISRKLVKIAETFGYSKKGFRSKKSRKTVNRAYKNRAALKRIILEF